MWCSNNVLIIDFKDEQTIFILTVDGRYRVLPKEVKTVFKEPSGIYKAVLTISFSHSPFIHDSNSHHVRLYLLHEESL